MPKTVEIPTTPAMQSLRGKLGMGEEPEAPKEEKDEQQKLHIEDVKFIDGKVTATFCKDAKNYEDNTREQKIFDSLDQFTEYVKDFFGEKHDESEAAEGLEPAGEPGEADEVPPGLMS